MDRVQQCCLACMGFLKNTVRRLCGLASEPGSVYHSIGGPDCSSARSPQDATIFPGWGEGWMREFLLSE